MVWPLGALLFVLSVYFFPWSKDKRILLLFACHAITAVVLMLQTKLALGVLLLFFGILMGYFWMFLVQHMGTATEKEKKIKVNTKKIWIKFLFSLFLGVGMYAFLSVLKTKESQDVSVDSIWLRLVLIGLFLSLLLMNRKMTTSKAVTGG